MAAMHTSWNRGSLFAIGLAAGMLASSPAFPAATITIINNDGVDEGFNDPTPVSPVGGNTGTTLGQQRLIAFQQAAAIWGGGLNSAVEIRVDSEFNPLFCDPSGAILGAAGPSTVHRDFSGTVLPNTWYVQALANRLVGTDLSPSNDIHAQFNSAIDTGCSPGLSWYYGLDASTSGGQIDLVTVVLHELAHGLGFLSLVDLSTGQRFMGRNDVYMLDLEDHSAGLLYPAMTDAERVTASTDTGDLHWVGPWVVAASGSLVDGVHPSGHVEMYAPNPAEPGSSVSHFSTDVLPDEIMEPMYTGPNHDLSLTLSLFHDIGWFGWFYCGDGSLVPGEECDDGNLTTGDGCSPTCDIEPCFACSGDPSVCTPLMNGTSCDDGNACTSGETCTAGVCAGGTDVCPLDHYKCYQGKDLKSPKFLKTVVDLTDQLQPPSTLEVQKIKFVCTPVDKNGEGINDPSAHLTCYQLKGSNLDPRPKVEVSTQFQTSQFEVKKPKLLCVPSTKKVLFP